MNVTELRNELVNVFTDLRSEKIKVSAAKQLINCAGKVLSSAKIEADYNRQMNNNKKIDFLENK